MRKADISKYWERINKLELYDNLVEKITFSGADGLKDGFQVEFLSTINGICGKNGVGKSSFLKCIYTILSGNDIEGEYRYTNLEFEVVGKLKGSDVLLTHEDNTSYQNVYYLESSKVCSEILSFLAKTENVEELKDGIEVNEVFNKAKNKDIIEQIIGKKYKRIDVYEIPSALGDDTVFPLFELEDSYGVSYSNVGMGMGEFHCLYIAWYMNWVENKSLVLVEEPENFISVYSQEYLVHYMAKLAADNKLWCIVSTHSYQVLSAIGFENSTIISRATSEKSQPLENRHKNSYVRALGLNYAYKGAILVEDKCAAIFTKFLLRRFYPELLFDFQVVELRCDSNLEKMIKHFEPNVSLDYEFIVVFDADQSEKLKGFNRDTIYSTALPANDLIPPEKVIYESLLQKHELISKRLDVDCGFLLDVIDVHVNLEYHEIYKSISKDLDIEERQLFDAILNVWLMDDNNATKAKFFVASIVYRNQKLKCESNEWILKFTDGVLKGEEFQKDFELENDLVSLTFDGLNSFVNGIELK